MREYKSRARNKCGERLTVVSRRISRNSLSTDIGKRKLLSTYNLRGYDWSSWTYQLDLAITWYGYKLAITIASLTAFFTGIGQILFKLMGH